MNNLVNKIHNENCLETMSRMPDNFIDLTVTSPPYDNLRTYEDEYKFDFEPIANELYRVTKEGGVVVWVVGDETVNGTESGTSFRHALYFKDIGFNIHDTMIYNKNAFQNPSVNRYHQVFEYMFVLSKGKPKTFNPLIDRKNKKAGRRGSMSKRLKNGDLVRTNAVVVGEYGMRFNIWHFIVGKHNTSRDEISFEHPATFPEELAGDHIKTWSNEGDIIYDPMSGSGTTVKMAILNDRKWIGSEMVEKYYDISIKRIKPYLFIKEMFGGNNE